MAETLPTTLAPARLPVPAGGMMDRMKGLTAQPAVARALPLIGIIAALGLAAMLWMAVHTAPQRTLFSGLADADKQAVAEALSGAGIDYAIDGGTGALTVDEGKFYQAKMLLAAQGLPKAAPSGEDTIAALPMGASRAVEGERLRTAREMDLARTIEAIDAVETARVHLAVATPSVFVRDQQRNAASVMLKLRGGRTLSDAQVQAIVHLVGSSVPGLSPGDVSVVDQSGRLLSQSTGGNPEGDAGDRQVALQNRIEDRYKQSLNALLAPLVGEDGFTAEVHADLVFDEVAATRETYPKDTAVIRQEQGSWSSGANAQQAPVGIPGTLSNTAPPAAQVATAPTPPAGAAPANGAIAPGQPAGQAAASVQGKMEESYNRTFDVGREVSVTRQATGTVRRLSVAVALKEGAKPRTPQEMQQIEALVKGAVGFDQQRGDLVAVSSRKFVEPVAEEPAWYEAAWLPMVGRNVAAVLAAAFVVFGIARPMMKKASAAAAKRREEAEARRAQIGEQMQAALAEQAAADPDREVTLSMIEQAPSYAARAQLIRNFVKQDPDRAALVLRDLIRADTPAEAA